MATAGDIPTKEALAAVVMLRESFPDLKIRFINVVDGTPARLVAPGLRQPFHRGQPIIFNFHGYPWLIHRLACRRRA